MLLTKAFNDENEQVKTECTISILTLTVIISITQVTLPPSRINECHKWIDVCSTRSTPYYDTGLDNW